MKNIIVDAKTPVRLDRFLRRYYPALTQGVIEKGIRNRAIKLSGEKATSGTRVKEGDVITITDSIIMGLTSEVRGQKKFSPAVKSLAKKLFDDYLLLDNDYFMGIDKPSGLAVQGGSKVAISVDDALAYLNSNNNEDFKIVHRLDKNTSGVLLIAKGYENSAKLADAFSRKLINKTYIAIVDNVPKQSQGVVRSYIGKVKSGGGEIVAEMKNGGKLAETKYKLITTNQQKSIIEFKPITGRMHQLRVHSKLLGCPIVGDSKYGGTKNSRMLLHAKEIIIPAELFGSRIIISSSLSDYFSL